MYVETVPNRNSPPAILLRESFRDQGKVRKRTLANLSKCPPHAIDALKAALKGEPSPASSTPLPEQIRDLCLPSSRSCGCRPRHHQAPWPPSPP
ncbi:MAG: hypothetical protein ACI8T1_005033 [Verrucomicrobiales bacterium]|jgi:hypothetical protein